MNYIIIPTNREDKSVIIPEADLLKRYSKEVVQSAVDNGTTINFRGTKCFLDEALE